MNAPRCIVFAIFALLSTSVSLRVSHAAEAYIIVDHKSGHVLEEQKPRDKRQVGSLTKVAAALVALDWSEAQKTDLSQTAIIPAEALAGSGENLIGFQPGDEISLRDLLYASLVQSDGIASYTLAAHVGAALQGGSQPTPVAVDAFVQQMNALARTLNMERTRFSNPSGQDAGVKPLPYSTAADMARLTRYAMQKAAFRFYVAQKERQITFRRGGRDIKYMLRNTNELLGTNGIDGVKTGRTARAGDCLILSAERKPEIIKNSETSTTIVPRRIHVVLLGSPNRFVEGRQLMDRGWQLYDQWAAAGRPVNPKKAL